MKERINACPKLYFMDTNAPVYLHTDASKYGIGAYLFQVVDGMEQPISYMSRALSKTELRWSTTDKEAYAIVYALYKFEHLLRDVEFTIRTDHKNLTYMVESRSERVNRWRDYLQRFHCNVEHIPGKDNVLADAFSRIMDLDAEVIRVLTEEVLCNGHMTVEYLYSMPDGKVRIPNDLYRAIGAVHNSSVGHLGVDKTREKLIAAEGELVKKYTNLRPYIRQFIKQCPCCQKMSTLRIPIHTHKYTLAAYAPMYRVSIDTINLDEADIYGNKYIIVAIDCFSRWIELYAVPDLTAVSAAQAIIQWCGTFGVPNEIHSDLGTQYINQVVEEMEQLMGFTHTFNISPHSKEENGLVERANKEVMRHLRSYIFDKNIVSDWSINLPFVKRIVNSSRHEAIGCSPADIVFGKSINLDWNIIIPRGERDVNITTSEYMDKKLAVQDAIIEQAARIQRERDDRHMMLQNTSLTEYKTGSYVLLCYPDTQQRPGPPSKLMTNIRGPMKVVKQLRQGNYTLEDLTTGKETRAHVSRMVPFYYDDRYIDPRLVANKDRHLHELEEVLKHAGERAQPKSLRFLARWQKQNGVRPRDTWEDYTTIKNTEALHRYLLKHKMKSLIPAVYKKDYV
jgi:transposase InsO family protein